MGSRKGRTEAGIQEEMEEEGREQSARCHPTFLNHSVLSSPRDTLCPPLCSALIVSPSLSLPPSRREGGGGGTEGRRGGEIGATPPPPYRWTARACTTRSGCSRKWGHSPTSCWASPPSPPRRPTAVCAWTPSRACSTATTPGPGPATVHGPLMPAASAAIASASLSTPAGPSTLLSRPLPPPARCRPRPPGRPAPLTPPQAHSPVPPTSSAQFSYE
jgi:hypothetical protein